MKVRELKVARIGNSRGVRLPAASLKRYAVADELIMEERADGILLRPKGPGVEKLSWEETAREMAGNAEDWSDWDAHAGDGLDSIPWESPKTGRIAERGARYKAGTRPPRTIIRRYEIRWAVPDPSRGSEMAKTRPVVIVSLDELNRRLQTVTIFPITSELHPAWRSRLPIRCAGRPAEIAVDQIRTISKSRLRGTLGSLPDTEASSLRRLITEMFGE
jgi:mRNA interferase MazF